MYLSLPTLLPLLCTPFFVYAQSPNPFNIPSGGLSATGGKPLSLSWKPTTGGTVSLILRSGQSTHLDEGTTIASKIDNSGSYTWTPSNSIAKGDDYTIEIVDDSNPDLTNYTPSFALDTTTTGSKPMGTVSLGASSSTTSAPASSGSTISASSVSLPIVNTFTHKSKGKASPTMSGSSTGSTNTGASTATGNGAARATAMAMGMFGVALGALAM